MKKIPSIKSFDPNIQNEIQNIRQKHEAMLADLGRQHNNHSMGYFGPESMTWKLYREPSIVLGSMRALLLQIAHPAVAAGVVQFSDFEKDTAGRAHRTFLSMVQIWFGDIPTANNSARRLQIIHSMIRGQMVWETEDETIINPFCAADPDLLYWVLATLVDTTILMYEKTLGKLTENEKEQFFQESKITAQLMGIPLECYPENLKDFYSRFLTVLENGSLRLGKDGQAIKRALFNTPYPIRRVNEILAEGFLPEQTKKFFGFKSTKSVLTLIIWGAKIVNRFLPNDLRYAPHYHQAQFRLALSNRTVPRWIERWHYWLSTHINWYFISNKLTPRKARTCPF